ncbi:MAG: serine hydrolase, partial [Candidatus Lokiarchaeota archaeon]|nr:serine hydrolase [Candidatus Lokiarchaeota archaeon]
NGEKPAMTEAVRVENEPGTVFQYSNHGYGVLQQLLIDIENKPFPEIVRETVFNPIGMAQSTFEQPLPQKWLPFAASGHRGDGPPIPITSNRLYSPRMAAGGLWTTAADLAKFIIELQLSLHNNSNKVLSADMVQEMFTPVVSEKYGLGIGISEMDDEIYLSFFGDIVGFFAGFVWHKTEGYGAVIVSNSTSGLELEREIFRSIANVYVWKGYLPQQYETVEVEPELLEKYTGRYLIGSDNVLTVSLENNVMYMQTSETDRVKLFPVARDKFVLKEREVELVFIQDSSGAVVKAVHQFTYLLDQFASQKFTSKRLPGDYKIPLELLLEGKIKDAMEEYQKIKATNPDDPYISEGRFNMLGYSFIYQGKLQQAITVFKINVDLYPESWNVYDSLGEVYMLNGDTEVAIKNYEKSLELNPSSAEAIEKLKKLKEK